jgi:hypothetical protein
MINWISFCWIARVFKNNELSDQEIDDNFLYYNIQYLFVWTFIASASGIIKTNVTWSANFWKYFSPKVTSGQINEQNVASANAFYSKSLLYILPFLLNGPLLVWNKCRGNNFLFYDWHRKRDIDRGVLILNRVKVGESFLKG